MFLMISKSRKHCLRNDINTHYTTKIESFKVSAVTFFPAMSYICFLAIPSEWNFITLQLSNNQWLLSPCCYLEVPRSFCRTVSHQSLSLLESPFLTSDSNQPKVLCGSDVWSVGRSFIINVLTKLVEVPSWLLWTARCFLAFPHEQWHIQPPNVIVTWRIFGECELF